MGRILISEIIDACLSGVSIDNLEEIVNAVAQLSNASSDPYWLSITTMSAKVLNAHVSKTSAPETDLRYVLSCLIATAETHNKMIEETRRKVTI